MTYTPNHVDLVNFLDVYGAPATAAQIAAVLDKSVRSVGGIIASASKKGLVEKLECGGIGLIRNEATASITAVADAAIVTAGVPLAPEGCRVTTTGRAWFVTGSCSAAELAGYVNYKVDATDAEAVAAVYSGVFPTDVVAAMSPRQHDVMARRVRKGIRTANMQAAKAA